MENYPYPSQASSSTDTSTLNSQVPSRVASPNGLPKKKERGRVRWNEGEKESTNETRMLSRSRKPVSMTFDGDMQLQDIVPPSPSTPSHSRNNSGTNLLQRHDAQTPEHEKGNPFADSAVLDSKSPPISNIRKPRPSVLRNNSANSVNEVLETSSDDTETFNEKAFSALAAQERAQRVATLVGSHSAPGSRRNSLDEDSTASPFDLASIPLAKFEQKRFDDPLVEFSDDEELPNVDDIQKDHKETIHSKAHKLVRAYTQKDLSTHMPRTEIVASGQTTPDAPERFRGGVLSALLKLQNQATAAGRHRRPSSGEGTLSPSLTVTPGTSGTSTPQKVRREKWYNHKNQSNQTLQTLMQASAMLSGPAGGESVSVGQDQRPSIAPPKRPKIGKRQSSFGMSYLRGGPRIEDEIRITVHIAQILSRQKYLVRLCKALMKFGAPMHRLEEYLNKSASVLEIKIQTLYMPGTMLIAFDDESTHTTEVKLVKEAQGVDLGRLKEVHEIYKEVVHDMTSVDDARERLDELYKRDAMIHVGFGPGKWHIDKIGSEWAIVFLYGIASMTVGPFAYSAQWIDLPICFILGCVVGFFTVIVGPRSDHFRNVSEVACSVIASFLARAFGSIRYPGGGEYIFCFSSLAQSAITLILPGYIVLCAALELQSRSMVAGSVRMVHAIIYSLFLGFGITIGTTIFGLMYDDATSQTKCAAPIAGANGNIWNFFFVLVFTLTLCTINFAKWKQVPYMLGIAMVGYTINFFAGRRFPSNAQLQNTLGAFGVGTFGNLYSRLRHGMAAAAMLPAIFVQVPSGLAASGSLLAGLSSADQITNSTTSTYANGTSAINGTSSVTITSTSDLNSVMLNVGYSMIQIAIGITVGLFLSALVIYPSGKRRSGLFSF